MPRTIGVLYPSPRSKHRLHRVRTDAPLDENASDVRGRGYLTAAFLVGAEAAGEAAAG